MIVVVTMLPIFIAMAVQLLQVKGTIFEVSAVISRVVLLRSSYDSNSCSSISHMEYLVFNLWLPDLSGVRRVTCLLLSERRGYIPWVSCLLVFSVCDLLASQWMTCLVLSEWPVLCSLRLSWFAMSDDPTSQWVISLISVSHCLVLGVELACSSIGP